MDNRIFKIVTVIALSVSAACLSGCYVEPYEESLPLGDDTGQPSYTPYEPPAETTLPEPVLPEPITPGPATPINNSPVTMDDQRPPDNVTWISPGKVMIDNFHAGARAEYPVTIHNGSNVATEFLVYYRVPGHVGEGYVKAPARVEDWVIIIDSTPVLAARETKDILIVLEMPETANDPAPKWEFWVGVKDNSQAGMVQTELAVRWLVNMRES